MTTAYFHPQYWLMGSLHVSAYPCPSATVSSTQIQNLHYKWDPNAHPLDQNIPLITELMKQKKKLYCTTRREVLQRLIYDTIIVST